MKCYNLTDTAAEGAVSAGAFGYLVQFDITDETSICAAAKQWQIEYYIRFVCSACSDNGIDDVRIKHRKTLEVTPDMIVLKDDAAVGIYMENKLFLFANESTHCHSVRLTDEYVGGWGDVTETEYFMLKEIIEG